MNYPVLGHRCQINVGTPYQCALHEGHDGQCQNEYELREAARRNANPTLEDIRRVIREEIEAALKNRS
jgi:hypothetical protein